MSEQDGGPDLSSTPTNGTLATVVAALYALGRTAEVDWDLEVFEVPRRDGGSEPLVGVVMSHTRAVVIYAVHPEYVPAAARGAVAELITRQNTQLATAAFELDLDTGNLSLRSGFAFPEVELELEVVQVILERLMDDVEEISRRAMPALTSALDTQASA